MVEVYYVEDDQDIAMTVKEYLEQRAYTVSVFGTLESARKAFQRHVPGIVLIDWNLPDGEGAAFCKWVRSRWRELPILCGKTLRAWRKTEESLSQQDFPFSDLVWGS